MYTLKRCPDRVDIESVCDGVEHSRDIGLGALWEFVVVETVPRGSGRKHNVISFLPSWSTLSRVIVLKWHFKVVQKCLRIWSRGRLKGGRSDAYRRPKVVANLVSKGKLRHFRRDPRVVIHEGNDPGVQTPLCSVRTVVNVFFVALVSLTNTTRGTCV